MDIKQVRQLLEEVQAGTRDVDEAINALRTLPFADLAYARIDHHRALRAGMPETVLAQGKSAEHIAGIARHLIEQGQRVLITRLDADTARTVLTDVPELRYAPVARVATHGRERVETRAGEPVCVVTAGTGDIPVAEEAVETLEMFGAKVERIYDVGVAGLHRIVKSLDVMSQAPALIVVAGMEGALPSVVGGMIGRPMVAVPTSVGYGAAAAGFTALFGMLTGCASGVSVVNIDNGFGAAMAVIRILRAREQDQCQP
jgi:hypothetical protein